MPGFFFSSSLCPLHGSPSLALFRLAAKKDRYWWNFFMGKRNHFSIILWFFQFFLSLSHKYIFFPLILHKEKLYDMVYDIISGTCYVHPIVLFMRKELSTSSFDSSFFHTNMRPCNAAGITPLIKFLWITYIP